MKRVPESSDIVLHVMKIATSQMEYVGDDAQYIIHAGIENGGLSSKQNEFQIRVNESNAAPRALAHGGLAIWSNIRPEVLRKATVMGLEYLTRSGQLDVEMFVEGDLDSAGS